jgi:hypothetical protein
MKRDDTNTRETRFHEADQRHESKANDYTDITARARLYRRDLRLYEMTSSVSYTGDKRTINVIFPTSRHQLHVSTLTDLHSQLEKITSTTMSYRLTNTDDVHGEEVHQLPTHRSTVYVHELCSNCKRLA